MSAAQLAAGGATARPLPPDDVMEVFYALATGAELLLHPDSGRIDVLDGEGVPREIDGGALDDLVARGWLAVNDDEEYVASTESGLYWLRKWLKRQGPRTARKPVRSWRQRRRR